MKRTKEDAEETRRNLIKVGVHVFHEKSYAATRMVDIAEAAGVTRGAIYHHFGNKLELLKAVAMEHRDMLYKHFADAINKNAKQPLNAIRNAIVTVLNKLNQDDSFRHFMEILIKTDIRRELPEINEIFAIKKQHGHFLIRDTLNEAKNIGQIKDDLDTSLLSFFITSSIFGIITVWMDAEKQLDLNDNAELLADYILAITKV